MARSRLLKPDFFKDEDLAEVTMEARLLFAGLWTIADREGRLEDRPKRIRVEVFPYDNVDVDARLTELAKGDFIVRYSVNGEAYIAIPTFTKHQNPHHREPPSVIPPPQEVTEALSQPGLVQGKVEAKPEPAPSSPTARRAESESESESVHAADKPPPCSKRSSRKKQKPANYDDGETQTQEGRDFVELVKYFTESWEAKYKNKYPFERGKDGVAMWTVFKHVKSDLAHGKAVVDAYLSNPDAFMVKARHSVGVMRTVMPVLLAAPVETKPQQDVFAWPGAKQPDEIERILAEHANDN